MAHHIRTGIVGSGMMALVHARATRAAGGIVRGVTSSTPASARRGAEAIGAERPFDSLEELLADRSIDLVHICTPNTSHHAIARAVIAAGKHVVCEKPLAVSVDLAEDLTVAAENAGLIATVPFVYRHYALVREARARFANRAFGPVHTIHGAYRQDWLARPDASNWRVDSEQGGPSRAFADIGVHWCDLAEFVSGHRITAVSAEMNIAHSERGGKTVNTEDSAAVIFRTDLGALGTMLATQVSSGSKNALSLTIEAADASLSFEQERPEVLVRATVDETATIARDTSALSPSAQRFSRLPAGHPQGYQEAFVGFVEDVHAAIRGEQPDGLPTFRDGLRAAKLTRAVLQSSHTGTWIEVEA